MSISTPYQPNATSQSGSTYKGAIDDALAAGARLAFGFACFAEFQADFLPADVSTSADTITLAGHNLPNTVVVQFSTTGTLPTGLSAATNYYVVNRTATTIQVSATEGGAAIDITAAGSGIHTVERQGDMKVIIAAGAVFDGVTQTEVAPQLTAALTAPSGNPRKDIIHVDARTGVVGVGTGAEAASPADPAIPNGKIPLARLLLYAGSPTMTEITNSDLTDDLRPRGVFAGLGPFIQKQRATYVELASGSPTGSDYTGTPAPSLASYEDGMKFALKFDEPNTGAVYVDLGPGRREVVKTGGESLASGDIERWQIIEVVYNDNLGSGSPTPGALEVQSPLAAAGGGKLKQMVSTETGAVATGTTTVPYDDTIPQNTEGTEFMTLAITPTSATNKLEIKITFNFSYTVQSNYTAALFQDSTANALAAAAKIVLAAEADTAMQITFTHIMDAGTTSATTFKVRAGGEAAGTTTFNGVSGARKLGGVMASSIVIKEIEP